MKKLKGRFYAGDVPFHIPTSLVGEDVIIILAENGIQQHGILVQTKEAAQTLLDFFLKKIREKHPDFKLVEGTTSNVTSVASGHKERYVTTVTRKHEEPVVIQNPYSILDVRESFLTDVWEWLEYILKILNSSAIPGKIQTKKSEV